MNVLRTIKDHPRLLELTSLIVSNDEIMQSQLNALQDKGNKLIDETTAKNVPHYNEIKSILMDQGLIDSLDKEIVFSIKENFIGLKEDLSISPEIKALNLEDLPKGLIEALRRALG